MRVSHIRYIHYLAACLLLAALVGGCSPNTEVAEEIRMEVKSVPETAAYRDAAAQGNNSIAWIEGTAAGSQWRDTDTPQARDAVRAALRSAAPTLASVDYPALSLPDFVTTTRSLHLQLADFEKGELWVDAYGQGSAGGERWVLYGWRGPEIPQHPDRPLVHRWVSVFVLYDLTHSRVSLLLPTIRGEVYE